MQSKFLLEGRKYVLKGKFESSLYIGAFMGSFIHVENEVCEVLRFNSGQVQALRHASCRTQKILPFTDQGEGMDICWDSPSVSIASHGTVGWDGMDIAGIPPVCPLLLPWWYSGMGWTFVRQWRMSQEHLQFGIPTVPLDTCW